MKVVCGCYLGAHQTWFEMPQADPMEVVTAGLQDWGGLSRDQILAAVGLNVAFESGKESCLYTHGCEKPVWDFVGGYGATLFGHNHPALLETLADFYARRGVTFAQGSVRTAANELCRKLGERLYAELGTEFSVVLANTGAEAVEIAAKHADLAYAARRAKAVERACTVALPEGPTSWTIGARRLLERIGLSTGPESFAQMENHNRRILEAPPTILALRGSFHGMTARALDLTDNYGERFGKQVSPSRVAFVEPDSPESLRGLLDQFTSFLLRPRQVRDRWEVEAVPWLRTSGFFIEPVQGEGGIRPVAPSTAQAWQEICRRRGVPLIADEIQSGMGRTGSFVHCRQLGIQPDYVLLGKSLGGGIAKISAAAIRRDRFLESFTLLHASTFAEDELSSLIALRSLELLDAEDAFHAAAEKGARLHETLCDLARRHPNVIKEVRGSGLMLGLEWKELPFERSRALRFVQAYGWLGYVLSGYLLRVHRVRVAPSLSRGHTMRLEPPYSIPEAAIQQLVEGLEDLCVLLEQQDGAGILGPPMGIDPPLRKRAPSPPTPSRRLTSKTPIRSNSINSHVAFIGHFIDPDGVALWDESFSRLGTDGCRSFLDRIHHFAAPLVYDQGYIHSVTGEAVLLSFIGLPVTSDQCYEALQRRKCDDLRGVIQQAVDLAHSQDCSVVGLGGYCSILTRNGKDLQADNIAVTTGNGYAVGATLLAMKAAVRSHGITWDQARTVVIGATGNIGNVLASLLAREVGSIELIGRDSRRRDLESMAGIILRSLVQERSQGPIARALSHNSVISKNAQADPALLYGLVREDMSDECPIEVGSDLSTCRSASLIASVSNMPAPILFPNHLGDQPTVIVDLAVPGDVDGSVITGCPHVRVVHGGVVRTPANPDWYVPGIPLGRGEMFACMAETVLMGLERTRCHGSFGPLTSERVLETIRLAQIHGFADIRVKSECA